MPRVCLDGSRPLWDRYLAGSILVAAEGPQTRDVLRQLLERDSLDFLATWLRGSLAASGDTAEAAALLREAAARPDHPGVQASAAFVFAQRNRGDACRAAYLRASDGWAKLGRFREAAHARLFAVARPRDRIDEARAGEIVARALELARRTGDPLDTMDVAISYGAEVADAEPGRGLVLLRRALVAGQPPSAIVIEGHRHMGTAFKVVGQLDSSEARYREALAVASQPGMAYLASPVVQGLANTAKARGEMRESKRLAALAIADARTLGHRRLVANMLGDVGNTLLSMGRYSEARDTLLAAWKLVGGRADDVDHRVQVLDQLGGATAMLGRMDEARGYLDQALQICRDRRLRQRESFVLLHMATLERDQGRVDEGLRCNAQGLASARATGRRRAELMLLSQRADLLGSQDQLDSALVYARLAARASREIEPRNHAWIATQEATALAELGRVDEALAVLDTAAALGGEDADVIPRIYLLRSRGKVLMSAGRAAEAEGYLRDALGLARGIDAVPHVADIELWLGITDLALGRPDSAARRCEHALGWYETALATTSSSDERAEAAARWQEVYVELATAHARRGRPDEAFRTFQRSRSRELLALLESADQRASAPSDSLEAARQDAREALAELQARLVEKWSQPVASRSGTRALELRTDSLRRVLADLMRRSERSGSVMRATDPEPPSVDEIVRALGERRRLVAFFSDMWRVLRFDVDAAGVRVREIPGSAWALKRSAEAWRSELERGSDDAWRRRAAGYADTLLAGALDGAPRSLVLVLDGPLHAMPFEAMLVKAPNGARVPLIERVEVAYTTAPALLVGDRPADAVAPHAQLAAFGDPLALEGAGGRRDGASGLRLAPLPHAKREVEGLRRMWPDAHVYVGPRATEARFYDELGRSSMLHVASHGLLDRRDPSFSALLLARGESDGGAAAEDGLVQAFEVAHRRGQLDLVTLSACESGRGRVVEGEGLLGLSRAFTLAGARRLLASLWKVDDAATADFMLAFYRRLHAGQPPAAALRATKLEFLRASGTSAPAAARGVGRRSITSLRAHPSVWAAFVLHVTTPN